MTILLAIMNFGWVDSHKSWLSSCLLRKDLPLHYHHSTQQRYTLPDRSDSMNFNNYLQAAVLLCFEGHLQILFEELE